MEISLCMIVKDEEDVIERCLNSVSNVIDEVIIVDTGSSDTTIEKVKSLGAKVYNFKWINDFSKARNFSFSKATKDYILWIDADDILTENDAERLLNLKENLDENVDSVTMNYILEVDENNKPLYSLKRNRLVKRSRNFKWIGYVHEYLEVYGNIINSNISITHKKNKIHTNRNLKIYEDQISKGCKLSNRDIYYYANELYDNCRYDDAINQYIKFIENNKGWVEDIKAACFKLADCYSKKNNRENEFKYIFKSFEYGIPRSDFCCVLGEKFLRENKIDEAIFWYKLAINLHPREDDMALISHDTYTYLPWIQLCVCYFRKGDMKESFRCNEMAARYKPNDYAVKYNKNYFTKNKNLLQ